MYIKLKVIFCSQWYGAKDKKLRVSHKKIVDKIINDCLCKNLLRVTTCTKLTFRANLTFINGHVKNNSQPSINCGVVDYCNTV